MAFTPVFVKLPSRAQPPATQFLSSWRYPVLVQTTKFQVFRTEKVQLGLGVNPIAGQGHRAEIPP